MKRPRAFLAAASLLLVVAAWLMSRGDRAKPPPRARVEFRHWPKPDEMAKSQRRRTLPPAASAEEGPRPKRDPLLTALSPKSKSNVVFEARALRESPPVKLFLDCMLSKGDAEHMARMKREWGFDPLKDIDRFAVSSDVAVVSGDFAAVPWETGGEKPRAYGVQGRIYGDAGLTDGIAVWNGQVALLGSAASIEAAIDRLEDRAPPSAPPIPEWAAYGDVYGFLDAHEMAKMLGPDQQDLADRFRSALQRVELHVDASEDVALTADATGPVPGDVADLGKTLGTALSLGRIKAQAEGDEALAELLGLAVVSQRGQEGRFTFDLALPLDVLRKHLGPCPRGEP